MHIVENVRIKKIFFLLKKERKKEGYTNKGMKVVIDGLSEATGIYQCA